MSPPRHSCIFPGCHSVQGTGSVSLFKFPSNANVRKRWIDFVKRSYCGELKITTNTRLCSVHFTPDSYSNYDQVKSGFLKSPLTLVRVAEPTISVPGLLPTVPPTAGAAITATGITFPPESSPPTPREAACQCGHVKKDTREIGCQTERSVGKRTVATQMSKITVVNRTHTGSSVGKLRRIKDKHKESWESVEGFPADVPDGVSREHGLKLQDHLHIKKEEEELWESVEEKQETDITAVTVKSEDEEEEAQCSLLHWRQSEENIKGEPATCSSAKLMKVEPNGDISEGPEAANTCTQQDTDGEETDCSDTEDSEDWREPLSQSEAQSEHMDMSCDGNYTSDNYTKDTPHDTQKPFGCDVCGKRFGTKAHLKIHCSVHTGEKPFGCDVCGKSFGRNGSLSRHMIVHSGEKPFSCDVCGKRFWYKSDLKSHMLIHAREKPDGGDVCEKKNLTKHEVINHIRINKEVKPFGCDVCRKRFRYTSNLKIHMRIHTGEKPYCCDVCGQSFASKGYLTVHSRIHTGEKPFGCNVCQKGFYHRSHLQMHMLIHTGEKPHVCDVCQRGFHQRSNLKKHMLIHKGKKPFGCDVCGQSFASKGYLTLHLRIHTGEKPFGCDVCQTGFHQRSHLKRHMLIHKGEKLHVCDVCQKRFNKKWDLIRHVKIHTKPGLGPDPQGSPCKLEPTD